MRRLLALVCLPLAMTAAADLYVVDPQGTGDFPTIQAALDAVVEGDVIELTGGDYRGDGNRDLDFLGKAVTLRARSGSTQSCVIDCQGAAAEPHRAFHFHSGEGPASEVRGIVIGGGYAASGGGLFCESACSPTFRDCTFFDNQAHNGGAAAVEEGVRFLGCSFFTNAAERLGGGIHAVGTIEVEGCIFKGNTALYGGGLYLYWSSARVAGCLFQENHAVDCGGGAHCELIGVPEFVDCTFQGNTADLFGGALQVQIECMPEIRSCTLVENRAAAGGALWIGGLSYVRMEHTIIAFGQGGGSLVCADAEARLTCCDLFGNVGGDWAGCIAEQHGQNGNLSDDPCFCNPALLDYTLDCASPCAPTNPVCGLIGAHPVGCGLTAIESVSWGTLKRRFR